MKHLLGSILLLATMPGWAQTMLHVKMADNEVINVAVDGRYFNKRGTSVTVGDLPPGKHKLEIYTIDRTRRGRGYEALVYEGRVRTFDGMVTLFSYDPYSRMPDIQQQDINSFVASHPPAQRGMNPNRRFQEPGNNNPDNYPAQPGGGYDRNATGNDNGTMSGTANPAPTQPAQGSMTDAAIDQLKTNVASRKTDTEKETFLKDAVKGEQLTTMQVGMMMDWLNFESSKADFAEWAYPITVDKDAFSNLESKFTYKIYQDDLVKFLQGKR